MTATTLPAMAQRVGSKHRPPEALLPLKASPRIEEVLADLEQVILDEGFAHLSVEELAARVKTSRATLYSIAPSRDELVLLLLDRVFRRLGRESMHALAEQEEPLARLRAYAVNGATVYAHATSRFGADMTAFPAAQRLFNEHFRYATNVLAELISDGMRAGQVRKVNPLLAASGLLAAIAKAYDPELLEQCGLALDQAMAQLALVVIDGLSRD